MADSRRPLIPDWPDETEHVLATLQRLIQTTGNPVIRLCLKETHEDIVHLTATNEIQEEAAVAASA